jgi:hypothetical protein
LLNRYDPLTLTLAVDHRVQRSRDHRDDGQELRCRRRGQVGSAVFWFIRFCCVLLLIPLGFMGAPSRRFGIQGQMVSCDFQKIFRMGERVFVALPGLATDVQTV